MIYCYCCCFLCWFEVSLQEQWLCLLLETHQTTWCYCALADCCSPGGITPALLSALLLPFPSFPLLFSTQVSYTPSLLEKKHTWNYHYCYRSSFYDASELRNYGWTSIESMCWVLTLGFIPSHSSYSEFSLTVYITWLTPIQKLQ